MPFNNHNSRFELARELADESGGTIALDGIEAVLDSLRRDGSALITFDRDCPRLQMVAIGAVVELIEPDDEDINAVLPLEARGIFDRFGADRPRALAAGLLIDSFVEKNGPNGLITINAGDLSYRDSASQPEVVKRLGGVVKNGESKVLATASDLHNLRWPEACPKDDSAKDFYDSLTVKYYHDLMEGRVKPFIKEKPQEELAPVRASAPHWPTPIGLNPGNDDYLRD